MFPIIEIFGINVSTYGICTSVGLVLMGTVTFILSRRYKILFEDILFGELFSLLGAFIGAHILYGITNIDKLSQELGAYFSQGQDINRLFDIFRIYAGGMVFYGGLILGLLFGVIYCKIRKINIENFSDSFAVAIPLFHCFGRLGCFFSGCCYGIQSEFGFTSTSAIIDSCNNVNRFPVQLLESGINLIIFVVLVLLFHKRIIDGKLIFLYLIIYSVSRFF
ncbi:MAG: prolipoprotein diacylglyceryl transferase, partial [Ruminococcus sp.]|nr:prolipoprotein diacylglyceryl transferase [Ruminococcus sp.]